MARLLRYGKKSKPTKVHNAIMLGTFDFVPQIGCTLLEFKTTDRSGKRWSFQLELGEIEAISLTAQKAAKWAREYKAWEQTQYKK